MTNQDIDISMDNVVQYANQIRMPLDSWNKETQKQILSVMEAQRIASGLNVTTFYNTLLGSTCSYKTIQHGSTRTISMVHLVSALIPARI